MRHELVILFVERGVLEFVHVLVNVEGVGLLREVVIPYSSPGFCIFVVFISVIIIKTLS